MARNNNSYWDAYNKQQQKIMEEQMHQKREPVKISVGNRTPKKQSPKKK